MARAAASSAIAFSGLCVGISAAVLLCALSQSLPDADVDAAQAAARLDPAAHGMQAAIATFFTAITIIHVHLRAGGRRFLEVMSFLILCSSVALVELSLCMQPGTFQTTELLKVAAVRLLPHAAVATFYLSLVLIYVNVRAASAADGAGDERYYPVAVEVLNTVALAATLITSVLGSIAAALVFDTK